MNSSYFALRDLKSNPTFGKGDVLVLFGELFQRGYANGLVEEAEKRGMTIIRATVGRRDDQGKLRSLNQEELSASPSPIINIPLEAGFDLEPDSKGLSPVEQLRPLKLSNWQDFMYDAHSVNESRIKGQERFRNNVKAYVQQLEKVIPKNAKILVAHLMAGGVPRAKIVMPLMNRAFKGTGERYLSSEEFWLSGVGQLVADSFMEVTAQTFEVLLQETEVLRRQYSTVSYVAYGYHGTEVMIDDQFKWQTYTPYLQGWAKRKLEEISRKWFAQGVKCTVFNCPEILTNSSSIFQGVEVSLYPLLEALKITPSPRTETLTQRCFSKLKEGVTLRQLLDHTNKYLANPLTRAHCKFDQWPQHSAQAQMELMLKTSDELVDLHKDPKDLITYLLSEAVFESCGIVMLNESASPQSPVAWINHDLVAKVQAQL